MSKGSSSLVKRVMEGCKIAIFSTKSCNQTLNSQGLEIEEMRFRNGEGRGCFFFRIRQTDSDGRSGDGTGRGGGGCRPDGIGSRGGSGGDVHSMDMDRAGEHSLVQCRSGGPF